VKASSLAEKVQAQGYEASIRAAERMQPDNTHMPAPKSVRAGIKGIEDELNKTNDGQYEVM